MASELTLYVTSTFSDDEDCRRVNYSGSTYEELLAAVSEKFKDVIPDGFEIGCLEQEVLMKSGKIRFVRVMQEDINRSNLTEDSELRIKLKPLGPKAATGEPVTKPPKSPEAAPEPKKEEPKSPEAAPEPKKEEPKSPEAAPEPKKEEPRSPEAAPEPKKEKPKSPDAKQSPKDEGTKDDKSEPGKEGNGAEAQQEEAFPLCGSAPTDLIPKPTGQGANEQTPSGVAGAAFAKEKIWRGRDKLYVFFMGNEVDGTYDPDFMVIENWKCRRERMNISTVLAWARVWNYVGHKEIPYFEWTEQVARADIRVQFSETGGNWSKVGTDAMAVTDKTKPTMQLSLNVGSAELMESLVVHEFGHALGLEHEHQRSDFWKVMTKYLDLDKMKNDPFVNPSKAENGGAGFGTDWYGKVEETSEKKGADGASGGEEARPYDPTSIMHYWFDIKWIKDVALQSYDKIDKVVKDEKERKYLKGLHKRAESSHKGGLTRRPSQKDYEALVAAYGGKIETVAALKPEAIWEGKLSANKHLKAVTNAVWSCRAKWEPLGVQLDFKPGDLAAIEADNPRSVGGALSAVLIKWLQRGNATVQQMVYALESEQVDRRDLANDFRSMAGLSFNT